MAWNTPGGNDKDPWGNRGNQGPPDLDDIIRDINQRLNKFFGNNRGNGNGDDGNRPKSSSPWPLVGGVVFILVLAWLGLGFYTVAQAQQAVVLKLGRFDQLKPPGLHWNLPVFYTVKKVDVEAIRSLPLEATMLTEDNNIVDIAIMVQYQIADPVSYLLKVTAPDDSLRHATESALRQVVGGMSMDSVVTENRVQVALDVHDLLQKSLSLYQTGLQVNEVSMQEANPPVAVKAAFDDVNKAKEDEERLKNEAEAYANGIIPEARGQAKRMVQEAQGYKESVIARAKGDADRFDRLLVEYQKAPEVTRKRLYLETMEQVYSNTSKVMVDVEGGNNILYLPIDKIANRVNESNLNRFNDEHRQQQPANSNRSSQPSRGADRLRQLRDSRREVR